MDASTLVPAATLPSLAPVASYLLVVTLMHINRAVKHPVHPLALLVGVPAGIVEYGLTALLPLAVALLLFLVGTWLLHRSISGTTLSVLTVSAAITPIDAWWGLGLGLAGAFAFALVRTSRTRTKLVFTDTLAASGVTPYGLTKPTLDYLPQDRSQSRRVMYLAPFLLAGVLLSALALAALS